MSMDDARKEAYRAFERECAEMDPDVYAHTIGHEARFNAGYRAGQVRALEDAAEFWARNRGVRQELLARAARIRGD